MTDKAELDKPYRHLKLKQVSQDYKYVLFADNSAFASALEALTVLGQDLPYSFFCAPGEVSAIVPTAVPVPSIADKDVPGWVCFHIIGDMPFGSVQGLIATISAALKTKKIGVCVVSSYKTDLFFVRSQYIATVREVLNESGWNWV